MTILQLHRCQPVSNTSLTQLFPRSLSFLADYEHYIDRAENTEGFFSFVLSEPDFPRQNHIPKMMQSLFFRVLNCTQQIRGITSQSKKAVINHSQALKYRKNAIMNAKHKAKNVFLRRNKNFTAAKALSRKQQLRLPFVIAFCPHLEGEKKEHSKTSPSAKSFPRFLSGMRREGEERKEKHSQKTLVMMKRQKMKIDNTYLCFQSCG